MKTKVEFFVIRLDGEVYRAEAISDVYSAVTIDIPLEYLSAEDLNQYFSDFSDSVRAKKIEECFNDQTLFDEQEAKDLRCKLSRISMDIEEKEIEII